MPTWKTTKPWRMMRAALLSLVVLSGCGTTAVISLSPSTYSVSAEYGSLNGSWIGLNKGKGRSLSRVIGSPVPFAIATNDTFPTQEERVAIAKWRRLRTIALNARTVRSRYPLNTSVTGHSDSARSILFAGQLCESR